MKKKMYLIIAYILICKLLPCYAQDKYVKFESLVINDSPKLEQLTNILRKKGVDTFLVYQPRENEKDSNTFLMWKKNNISYGQLISKSFVSNVVTLKNNLFSYKYIFKCGVTTGEYVIGFVAPIFTPSKSGFIAFAAINKSFYFEEGNAITYVPANDKRIYRERWLALIRQASYELMNKSEQAYPYKRPEPATLYKRKYRIFNLKRA